ncbi:MAG: GNAT family N-acetyltransferase [Candidatus Methanomethylophilaceae archaeon]|nr:GNAT family N-acetyltransferase [Candidatus Methanomethylophilaceae archaeon]
MNKHYLYNIFSKIPILETNRLTLRRMKATDAGDMFEYASRADVTQYLTWNPHPDVDYTREYLTQVQKQYENGEFYDWAVILRDEMKMIGSCGFTSFDDDNSSGEIGYVLNPDFWGQGLMSEAVTAVLGFGFERLGLHRIEAKFMQENVRSRRVLEKCGMTYEGTHRDAMLVKGEFRTISVCAMLREEFAANNPALK